MANSYSRLGYMALKEETTENTAVTPDVFIPIMSEDITVEYSVSPATPVATKRQLNLRAIDNLIAPPTGTISTLVEPKTFGWFMKGVYGDLTSGQLLNISSLSGDFTVGETLTGGSSSETATVVATSTEGDYVLVSSASGNFTVGETVTGGTSSETATVVDFDTTRYGHLGSAPQSSLPTFTVEIGYEDFAVRYTGLRFNSFEPVAQAENIITADVGVVARAALSAAKVTAQVSSGAGAKSIPVDQTQGFVASDTIKVYREGTGYLDFSASGVETHTIGTVDSANLELDVTNLETQLEIGDLIVLAPQTTTYDVVKEFSWIGGSNARVAANITSAIAASCDDVEDFELNIVNTIEPYHQACGTEFADRFPKLHVLAALEGSGSFTKTFTDPVELARLRENEELAAEIEHVAGEIGSTGLNYSLSWRVPKFILDPFNANIEENTVISLEMPFTMYDAPDDGYFTTGLLINDETSY